jgi:CBS domain-containing membrane protein
MSRPAAFFTALPALLRWRPARMAVNARERLRIAAGALVGVLLTALLCHAFAGPAEAAWLVAPIGASAVLVFGLPGSPLAQPWPVLMGNTLSTLVGVACLRLLGDGLPVQALAVGLAILAMFALRCLHPPGGACALMAVMGHLQDPHFALFPVALNSLLLVLAGVAYNRSTGRRYPHGATQPSAASARPAAGGAPSPVFTESDLDAVLARRNELIDVSRDELRELLEQTELQAYRRRLGQLRCADVMSTAPLTVHFGTSLQEAWTLLRRHHVKALPVIDRARRVVGVVTLADFLRGVPLDQHDGWHRRLRDWLRPTGSSHSDKAEVVGQIMTREVRVASADRPLAELVPMFAASGHHHIPVIDAERRLVGILTQTDLVKALSRSA